MQIDPSNTRHPQIKLCKTIHNALPHKLSSPDFWHMIGRSVYAMDEETLRTKGKFPIFDVP